MFCQVQNPWDVDEVLTCPARESGGLRCERLDPHGEDGHRVGDHTIKHALWGNGYVCDGAEIVGYRTFGPVA